MRRNGAMLGLRWGCTDRRGEARQQGRASGNSPGRWSGIPSPQGSHSIDLGPRGASNALVLVAKAKVEFYVSRDLWHPW